MDTLAGIIIPFRATKCAVYIYRFQREDCDIRLNLKRSPNSCCIRLQRRLPNYSKRRRWWSTSKSVHFMRKYERWNGVDRAHAQPLFHALATTNLGTLHPSSLFFDPRTISYFSFFITSQQYPAAKFLRARTILLTCKISIRKIKLMVLLSFRYSKIYSASG